MSSLKRLNVDILPVVLLHRKDESTPLEESLDCLSELKEKGYKKTVFHLREQLAGLTSGQES